MKTAITPLLILVLLFAGEREKSVFGTSKGAVPGQIAATKSPGKLNETACFMAGLDLPGESKLKKLAARKDYKRYRKMVEKSWKGFLFSNMQNARSWSKKFLPQKYSPYLFYPFSGPDILHPLTFYPGVKDIVMFGLERIGRIPDPLSMHSSRAVRDLWGLPRTLNFTLRYAYFITSHMMRKVGVSRYTGITGLMMFFLARGGYEILNVRMIWLTGKGKILFKVPRRRFRRVPGVEIVFRKTGDADLKRVRFFRLDISNRSRRLPIFTAFIRKFPRFTTIIKSASYLMHKKGFSRIRSIVFKGSSSILQDDSGLPLRSFSEKIWEITYHGYYHRPLPVFRWYYQKELKRKLQKFSTGPLPFSYGYGFRYKDMKYHLIHASRKKK